MATIDPVASALDAIASYFGALTGIASGQRGWPEHPEAFDLTAGPVVTATAIGRAAWNEISPTEVDRVAAGGVDLDVTYRVAYLILNVQLDAWASHRVKRDEAGAVVEAGFHNRLPFKGGLELDSTGYFSRPLTITAGGGLPIDSDDKVGAGEWRKTWDLVVTTDLVVVARTPKQALITFRNTITSGGISITEPDLNVS